MWWPLLTYSNAIPKPNCNHDNNMPKHNLYFNCYLNLIILLILKKHVEFYFSYLMKNLWFWRFIEDSDMKFSNFCFADGLIS